MSPYNNLTCVALEPKISISIVQNPLTRTLTQKMYSERSEKPLSELYPSQDTATDIACAEKRSGWTSEGRMRFGILFQTWG